MSLKNQSDVDMIQGPEFINLQPLDINPLMSKCEIKVFYLGHNRNGSYINRQTALEMAKTLRGTPIVAAYNKDKEDFGDHGHIMHIEDGEITFSCKTIPYGFVSPDAEVWFQNFVDTDEFDNKVERTYLMTTGYLWSGQFEELTKVLSEGQPQSMELDSETLEGHWATDNNLGIDFFIITDAIFSKLCILGDDVEPCFEGASVTAPQVSKNFAQETEFQKTLYSMMNDLQKALAGEGGLNMSEELKEDSVSFTEEAEETLNEEIHEETEVEETVEVTEDTEETEEVSEGTAEEEETAGDDKDDPEVEATLVEEEKLEEPKTYSEEEYSLLENEVESLRAEINELREFKQNIELQQKTNLINSYYMLSDEDKADVIAHKAEYSYDEIKAKLAVLYVEKNVDFEMNDEVVEEDPSPAMTFSLDEETSESAPAFVELLRQIKNK